MCRNTGNADVLQLRERPTPNPAAGQVVVSQTKMGLNFLDVYQTSGVYPFPEKKDVFVPGNEGAGRILAVGEGVTGFNEGDRVGYPMAVGAFAERVIAADRLVHLPEEISDDMAAASMLKKG